MAIPNVNQITSMLRMMDDRPQNPELQRYAQLHKNNPFLFPLIVAEDTARKQMRMAAQAQTGGGALPKVNEQAVASIGQTPPPQTAQAPAGLPGLNSGMAAMVDGGIAGYPDEEEIGMAEGGVARYNGQDGSRVQSNVQLARDQEAVRILLSELQKEQAKAAQGNPSAQSNVEAIQNELRIHIRRNPSLAQMLTSALPMSAAQARPAAQQAAPMPTPAGQIPGTAPGIQAPPAVPEGFFSRLGSQLGMSEETKRNVGTILMAPGPQVVVTAPAKIPGQMTGLQKLHEGVRQFFSAPSTARKFTPDELSGIQALRASEQAAKAAEDAAEVARMSGALPGEAQTVAAGVQAAQAAKQAAKVPSAAERVQLLNQAQRAREAARAVQTVSPTVASAQTAKQIAAASTMALPSPVAPEAAPAVDGTYRSEGRNYPRKEDLSKDEKKDVIDAAKAATPKAERKGLTNDDYLVMGLTMMANPGRGQGLQGLLEAVGTGGIAAVQNRREREKAEREEVKEAANVKYLEAMGEQARRGPSEIALIERVAKENNIPFTQAMEMISSAKREPMTREKLFLEFMKQPLADPGKFNAYVEEYERRFGPLGGSIALPEGTKVRQVG